MTHTIVYAASPLIDAYAMTDSNQTHYFKIILKVVIPAFRQLK